MWYYKSYISEFFGNSRCDALPACVGAGGAARVRLRSRGKFGGESRGEFARGGRVNSPQVVGRRVIS
jgi:hypothetical protein